MMDPLTGPSRCSIGTAVCFRCGFSGRSTAAGYPRAVERLLRKALDRTSYPKRDAAILLQADFTESPDYIVPMIKTLEGGADVVAGVVEANGRPAPRAVRVARRMAPWVLGRAFGGAPVSDPLSGFRAYRLIVLKKALAEFRGRPFLGPPMDGRPT